MTAIAGNAVAHHHEKPAGAAAAGAAVKTDSATRADTSMQREMAQHEVMESVDAFPNYHPLVVHFPIVLLLMATLFQFISFFFYKKEFSLATLILLFLGVVASWLASNTFHADPGELPAKVKAIFDVHETMASYTYWLSLGALLIKIPSHFFLHRRWWVESMVMALLIASAITVSIAGHHGAMLVHLNGIGPLGHHLEGEHGM
jgi:uncharacterized membrane protein